MKRRDAARTPTDWDELGRSVWTTTDLATLFADDSPRALEAALSEHGVVSQVPMVRTIMATGRSGRVRTAFGTLELVRTVRSVPSILDGTVDVGHPLRPARARTALEDLRRVGRNLHLVDLDELAEIEVDERAA